MQCPHCLVHFHEKVEFSRLGDDCDGFWGIQKMTCAACKRFIFYLLNMDTGHLNVKYKSMVYPQASGRSPVPDDVPLEFREDYEEAVLILADSPKASAALSRRCLQHILREKAGVKCRNLYDEIQKVIQSNSFPTYLTDPLDMLRNFGNAAAHPVKNDNTGVIVPVEPKEAEWCLEVIELLFDFFFVRPADAERRKQFFEEKRHGANDSPNT